MRRVVLVVGAILIGASAAALAPDIEPEQVLAHIKFLSSDELKGRANGAFVLTPLEPGVLKRDSGTQHSYETG